MNERDSDADQVDPWWIDSHCHLPFDGEIPQEVNRAVEKRVLRLINVGVDECSSRKAIALAKMAGERVRAAIGQHPHDAKDGVAYLRTLLQETAENSDNPIVGIGECGLDYFYDHSPRQIQREVFAYQVGLANEFNLPLIIHCRDAWDETFAILRSEGVPLHTVLHCFTGDLPEAEIARELDLYISFSGIITFRKAEKVQEVAKIWPINRMMIETDSPFLAPVPFRGKPNEPANAGVVGECISKIKEVELREFSRQVSESTLRFFHLKPL